MRHETLHDPAIRSEHRTGSSTQGSPFAIEKDKNSLWNGLNVQKGKLYVKKKKLQDTGGFLKPFGENLTGSFCSGIRGAKDRGAILASRQKGGFFTHYSKMPKAWHRESEPLDSPA